MTERAVRVLWLVNGLGPGGAERLLVSAATTHDPAELIVEVAYLLPHKDHLVPALEAAGVRTHCLGTGRRGDPRWLTRLARLIRRGGFDVVHAHSPVIAAAARLLVRTPLTGRDRPALVATEHNTWATHRVPTKVANGLTFRLDDAHLAVSDDAKASIRPRRLQEAVEVVVQGIPLADVRAHGAERHAVRAELGVADADVVVGTVANLRGPKAYPVLLAAARHVLDAGGAAHFVAIGQGPLEDELRREHARLGLGDHFRFLGYRADAQRLMAGFDVFAMSSDHEGYPIALMEAMALGLPVVATEVGGIPDAVRDGVEGLLVPPRRPDLLGQAIIRLVGDAELRARLGAAAQERSERFDISVAVRRTEEVYRSLVQDRSGRRSARSVSPTAERG